MLEVASMVRFPNIEQLKDEADRGLRLGEARQAVAHLKALSDVYASDVESTERAAAAREAARAQSEGLQSFNTEVDHLRVEFLGLQGASDGRQRGLDFEGLLSRLFRLFDMEPRLAYDLDREQIDGSLTFDTDDYVVEARWRKERVDRGDADIFTAKVKRKGKNALGLFVSVNGFTQDALAQYSEGTAFITMDGADLYVILEQRLRLDDVLKAKRRHANETGSCYLPARELLGG